MTTPEPEALDLLADGIEAWADMLGEITSELDPRSRREVHRTAQGLTRARQLRAEADEMTAAGQTEVFDLRTWRKGS